MRISLVCFVFLLVSFLIAPEKERAKLNDLNDRLNALELELAPGKP